MNFNPNPKISFQITEWVTGKVIHEKIEMDVKIGWAVEATSGVWPSIVYDACVWVCYVHLTSQRIISDSSLKIDYDSNQIHMGLTQQIHI